MTGPAIVTPDHLQLAVFLSMAGSYLLGLLTMGFWHEVSKPEREEKPLTADDCRVGALL